MNRKPIVLFFIASCAPTPEELAACKQVNGRMRNASEVRSSDNPEKCDAVASLGEIPSIYAKVHRIDIPSSATTAGEVAPASVQETDTPPAASEQLPPADVPPVVTEEPKAKKKSGKKK